VICCEVLKPSVLRSGHLDQAAAVLLADVMQLDGMPVVANRRLTPPAGQLPQAMAGQFLGCYRILWCGFTVDRIRGCGLRLLSRQSATG
jgi:hypothetical protein